MSPLRLLGWLRVSTRRHTEARSWPGGGAGVGVSVGSGVGVAEGGGEVGVIEGVGSGVARAWQADRRLASMMRPIGKGVRVFMVLPFAWRMVDLRLALQPTGIA